jgi:outer membrane murein-binding lipoprotein Lpp
LERVPNEFALEEKAKSCSVSARTLADHVDIFEAKQDAMVEILRFAQDDNAALRTLTPQDDKRRHRRSVLGMTWRPEDTDRPG